MLTEQQKRTLRDIKIAIRNYELHKRPVPVGIIKQLVRIIDELDRQNTGVNLMLEMLADKGKKKT